MGTLYRLASHTKQPLPDTPLTMNAFITLFACVAAASAQTVLNYGGPGAYVAQPYHGVPAAYAAAAPAYAPVAAPVAAAPYHPSSQFQAQDEFGNIQYGYSNLNSVKQEVKHLWRSFWILFLRRCQRPSPNHQLCRRSFGIPCPSYQPPSCSRCSRSRTSRSPRS